MWNCLKAHAEQNDEGMTSDDLVERLILEYGIARKTASSDVNAFLEEATSAGIVIRSDLENNNAL